VRRSAPWLLLALGAALRFGLYLSRPSLSIDETMTSLEIGGRSFGGLLHILSYAQTAPPLFLWAVKLSTVIGGVNEYALRAVPLLLGLLVPLSVWRVAQRLLPEPAALAALLIAAVTPTLIEYSLTVKPYVGDAFFALAIAQAALAVLDRPDASGSWWRLAGLGTMAVLWSTPAPFYLAGVGVALVRLPQVRWRLALCAALWVMIFVPVYVFLFRPVAVSAYMQQFWAMSFFSPITAHGWRHLGVALLQSLDARPAPLPAVLVVMLLLAFGGWMWWRTGKQAALLFGVPGLALLAASTMHRYPLSGRVLIFLTPTLILCLAAAVARAAAWRGAAGWALALACAVLLLGIDVTHPYRTPATRAAIARLRQQLGPGEPVYVASGAAAAWGFYTMDWRHPDTLVLQQLARTVGVPGSSAFHNSASRGVPVGATEGAELLLRREGRPELLGLAPGIQWRDAVGFAGTVRADSGWAGRESDRIRAAASPTIWLLVANPAPTTVAALTGALAHAGGAADTSYVSGGVRVVRYRF